jgi:hypothetical protein
MCDRFDNNLELCDAALKKRGLNMPKYQIFKAAGTTNHNVFLVRPNDKKKSLLIGFPLYKPRTGKTKKVAPNGTVGMVFVSSPSTDRYCSKNGPTKCLRQAYALHLHQHTSYFLSKNQKVLTNLTTKNFGKNRANVVSGEGHFWVESSDSLGRFTFSARSGTHVSRYLMEKFKKKYKKLSYIKSLTATTYYNPLNLQSSVTLSYSPTPSEKKKNLSGYVLPDVKMKMKNDFDEIDTANLPSHQGANNFFESITADQLSASQARIILGLFKKINNNSSNLKKQKKKSSVEKKPLHRNSIVTVPESTLNVKLQSPSPSSVSECPLECPLEELISSVNAALGDEDILAPKDVQWLQKFGISFDDISFDGNRVDSCQKLDVQNAQANNEGNALMGSEERISLFP